MINRRPAVIVGGPGAQPVIDDKMRADHQALQKALDAVRSRVAPKCTLGVGCEEHGVCYAAAHGQPDRCGRPE